MRIAIVTAAACCSFGALLACAQPGDPRPPYSPAGRAGTEPAAAPAAACAEGEPCGGAAEGRSPNRLRPAAPAPESPQQGNCSRLPTQIERDICIDRKLTTT